jgi:MFS family permease
LGCYNIFIITCFLTSILILCLWIPASSNTALIIFSAFYGFTSGAFVSLGPALIVHISPMEKIGVRQGLLFFVASIGALVTGPIGGAITLSDHGGFMGLKVFAGVMCLAGSVFALLARIAAVGVAPFKKF